MAVVGVSIAVLAAGTFAISAFGVLAPKLADAFALSRADIGFVTSVVFLGAALGSAPAGRLTDRGHPARLLALAMSAFAGSVLLFALAPDRAILFAAAALAGLAYGCVNPPTNVIVAGQLARRLGFFLSLKQTGVPLGGLLAGAVLPPVAIAWGWRAAVGVAAVACALVAAATLLLRNVATIELGHRGRSLVAGRRQLVALGGFGFVMAGSQWAFLTYLVLFLTQQFRFGLAAAGLALALAQGLGACARLLWGWLSDKTGNRLGVLLLMAALQVVALELLALFPGRTLAWPLVALAGVTIVGWNGAFYGYVAESAGPGNVGQVSGQMLVLIFAGSVVFPPMLGALVDAIDSWRPLWAICGGAVAAAALGLGLTIPRGSTAGPFAAAEMAAAGGEADA
ncbi:MAG TPA: MFS transporter [Gaiellaceae bacterium]|nr:MFS transporter [Gaiellaceae bacterium]